MRSIAVALILFALFAIGFSQAKDDPRPVVDDSKTTPSAVRDPKLPTLWIVGDSTLNSNAPLRGWGQELAQFFDQTKINVVNRAIGGRSSRTFLYDRWGKIMSEIKKGDFVILQFGHNDVGRYDDPAAKDRPSLHSEGDETVEVTRFADGKKETVHSFGWYMRRYGDDVRARGATMIFCSMVPHKDWNGGHIVRKERDQWVKWTADAAAATHAAYIDLNEIVALEYERLGPEKVAPLFGDARTHSTPAGALLNAQLVISGIRALKRPDLRKYLSPSGRAIKEAPRSLVVSMK